MNRQEKSLSEPLIPMQPIPDGAEAFSERVHEMLDGKAKDEATVTQSFAGMDAMFDRIAAGLYAMASMLVGEGEQSVRLIETAISTAQFVPGESAAEARQSNRRALAAAAIQLLARREPASLATPSDIETGSGCIGDDDLDAAGVSGEELERMISGPDRGRLRTWLESLPTAMRVIFVLRAIAILPAAEIASLLDANGGPAAKGWTAGHVREISRQALCSLASQLLHATLS
ncbi:MAG TPA: hypothetical protein VG844_13050 [Terracidiphilus sp.]|jgi:hypothetical protein|nr:hypothetical protein [Terracidiphilus sp.]